MWKVFLLATFLTILCQETNNQHYSNQSEEKAEAEVDSNPKREAREMHLLSSDTGDKIGINIVPQVALVCLLVLAPVLLTFVVVCCLIQPICPLYKLVHKRAISRIASSRM